MNEPIPQAEETESEELEQFEGSPESFTDFDTSKSTSPGPHKFDRAFVLKVICISFALIVVCGTLFSTAKSRKQREIAAQQGRAAHTPNDFLRSELERSSRTRPASAADTASEATEEPLPEEDALPETTFLSDTRTEAAAPAPAKAAQTHNYPPPPPPKDDYSGGGGGGRATPFTAHRSALVPQTIEGSLFSGHNAAAAAAGQALPGSLASQFPYLNTNPIASGLPPTNAYDFLRSAANDPPLIPVSQAPLQNAPYGIYNDPYAAQNNQAGKQAFSSPAQNTDQNGSFISGVYLPDKLLWIGSLIPAVLETAVNTDLPGSILARVSENVYDSRTGKNLLIPQGSILTAKYNSSVSYAQHRIQIVWDTLIRPDGYSIDLGGMNAVDQKGLSGLKAIYRENWFEYLKAAGIITMFSFANAKMAETSAKYASNDMAAGLTASNADFINELGGNIVSRAMNIQPSLSLLSGEKVMVMLNKNMFLPPAKNYPVTQPYILK